MLNLNYSQGVRLSYTEWYTAIKSSFESLFFVSSTSTDSLVNCRNIYKDTLGASNKFGDYQLRPNFLIAMVVAPELFNKENALLSLNTVKDKLISPLGIKTLDESDWNYNGDYFNSDCSDYKTAGGFNYHQGPVRRLCTISPNFLKNSCKYLFGLICCRNGFGQ